MAGLLKAMGSTWTCALLHARRWHWLHSIVISVRRRVKAAERNRRWSGSIGYPELLNSSHGSGGCAQSLACKDLWKKLHHSLPVISDGTKRLVLEGVRRMVEACEGKEDIMRSYSGQCALNPWCRFFKDPTLHVGIDFDDKILSWYFATKMFLSWSSSCVDERQGCWYVVVEPDHVVEAIRAVSNYMIFLLVERPYMLPSPVRPGLYANAEAAYVGLEFSDRKHISKKLWLDRRKRMWDLDERTDWDELYRVRGKLDIIWEDLDIIRKDPGMGNPSDELRKTLKELDRRLEELYRRRREKPEVLNRRRKELDGIRLTELELDRQKLEMHRWVEIGLKLGEKLDPDREELNRILKSLEELDRRSEELRFGPPPPPALVRGAEIAVRLLEMVAQDNKEVTRVLFGVWVDMLCYAAHHCSRDSHARQLNNGGEFITVVWLLSTTMFNRRYCDEPWFKKGV